jgi:subtilisin family serine protease
MVGRLHNSAVTWPIRRALFLGKAIRTKTCFRLGDRICPLRLAASQYTQRVECDADHIPLITFLLPRGRWSYLRRSWVRERAPAKKRAKASLTEEFAMAQSLASGTAIVVCAGLAVSALSAPARAQSYGYPVGSPYKYPVGSPYKYPAMSRYRPSPYGGWGHRGGMGFGGYGGYGGFGSGAAIGMGMGIAASMIANGPPPQVETQSDPQRPPPKKPRPRVEAAKPPPPPPKAVAPPPPSKAIVSRPPPARPPAPALAARARLAPAGETRFRRGEVVVTTAPGAAQAMVTGVLQRHGLVEVDATYIALTNETLRLWRIPDAREVGTVVAELGGENSLRSIQPNYVYAPQGEAAPAEQYSLGRLNVDASLDLATSEPIRVAVIDTAIDAQHPDLKGAVESTFDALAGEGGKHVLDHGTSIAGAIAARGEFKGVAPSVRILSARALDRDDEGAELGSTESVSKAIDWAATSRSRIVNMSFAGPQDPEVHALLAAAHAKGLVLIGAAGNSGPKSAPLYPGADENVLAVTATDADDAIYPMANAGVYVAVAAPGVDVLLPAPNGAYAMETGTSVSAALVSGVAALIFERRPEAAPNNIKYWLTATAKPLGLAADRSRINVGLVDARRAVEAAGAPSETASVRLNHSRASLPHIVPQQGLRLSKR